MLCEKCQRNEANVSIKKTINGVSENYYLCSSCANQESLFNSEFENFAIPSMANLLGQAAFLLPFDFNNISSKDVEKFKLNNTACSVCGQTFYDFKNKGLFGCPHCYQTFKEVIKPVLDELHGSHAHLDESAKENVTLFVDKSNLPASTNEENPELLKLKADLAKAISSEKYEQAAVLRDEIRELENKIKTDPGEMNKKEETNEEEE